VTLQAGIALAENSPNAKREPKTGKWRQFKKLTRLLYSLLQLPSTCEHRSNLLIIRVLFIFTVVIITQGSFSNLGVIGFQLLAHFASIFTSTFCHCFVC